MAVELGCVEHGGVSLSLLFVGALYLVDDVVEVEDAHLLLQLLLVLRWPLVHDLLRAYVDKSAIGERSNSTPSLVALKYLLVAKHVASPQVLQLVLDSFGSFANLPFLCIDWISKVVVSLDHRLHDQVALADDIECCWILADVIDSCALGHSMLLRYVVEVN